MAAFAPEAIFHIGSFPVTNTVINTLLVDGVIISGLYALNKQIKKIPSGFQNVVEFIIESAYNFTQSVAGSNTRQIFPYFMSFFLFILLANWSGLIPGVGTIGFFHEGKEHGLVPILRNATSDLNVTLALAIISFVATHMLAIRKLGLKEYFGHFFSFNPIYLTPIFLFVGVLEIISEFTKLVSLSFRLFGNIYAGEVVIHTISSIFAFLFPIPFLALELVVGLVQALVFSILTMAFMSILMTSHHEHHAESKGVSQ